ncbi:protein eyes shut homolog isoform X2 [Oryctolagus cuniculus]|uniref:protein eyes shut homolog isoform X2 n=1 Tax=Oryctolagus cuniculus TaxID=9986 RepID=UPI0038799B74
MTNRSISVLSLVVLYTSFVNGKTTCKQLLVQEWHPQPSLYVVNWTLTENICVDFYRECWALDTNVKMNTLDFQVIPQICPLQIQFGDILVISTESSLQSLELNLMNASEALFIDCLQNTMIEDQLLFDYKLKGMQTVNSQWLDVGTHYFISVVTSGPSLCQLGLRLNVTVKQQFCQETLGVEFCSGHGKCLSNIWNKSYSCQCQTPYSGKYCEELDVCYYKPCKNNGSCISRRGEWNKHGYECICNPPFTGRNCSEIIGRCQAHICFHGNCSNIIANSFICECDEEFSGPFCEDSIKPYDSWSCWKEGIYQNSTSFCKFEYPEEFLNQNCEFDTSECSSIATWNGTNCINSSNDVMCICSPMMTGKFCKIIEMPHESFPEKNNITCSTHEEDWHCSCIPGITGKIGEKVIDHCRLLSINCLDERWRFSIIGGFEYTCILWYTKNSSSCVKNIHLIHHSCCYCGVTCNDICGAKVLPQFDYVCQLESAVYEGEKFQVAIVAYFSLADNCVGNGTDMNTLEDISHVCCFPYEGIIQSCTDGCSILAEEESQSYWCICGLGWAVTLHLENTTDYPANRCQHEAQCKDEINITRFRVVNDEYWVGNQSSPEHRLFPAHLHNCNCSCLQRYGRNNSGTEYYKSVPCKTGATSIHLSGYFFCKCVSGFAGKYFQTNQIF